jgi:hypothetical protein
LVKVFIVKANMFQYYIYVYLNPLKQGEFCFGRTKVKYEPFYVGKGKGVRYNVHSTVIDKHNKLKQHIIDKIKTENRNPIIIKLYENISEYSAFRLEKYLINKIGRRDLGFGTLANLTDGGEGNSGTIYNSERRNNMISEKRPIIKYNNNGIVLEIFENIVELSIRYPHILTNKLHRVCKSNGSRRIDGYFWKYQNGEAVGDIININDEYKPILQYNLNGNFIKQWNCANEARKYANGGAILKCCRNNAKQLLYYKFKNFMWFFKNGNVLFKIKPYCENNAKGNNKIIQKDIVMYNINNELLGTYTPKELKNMGFNTKTIYGCCDNKFKITQGFKWKWAET